MSEIFQIYAQVAPRSGPGDTGRVAEGWYKQEGDMLTMCDPEGIAIRDVEGHPITHKLVEGERAQQIAARLTLKIYRSLRDDAADFNRPLGVRSYQRMVY
jgi:hypothetical protein